MRSLSLSMSLTLYARGLGRVMQAGRPRCRLRTVPPGLRAGLDRLSVSQGLQQRHRVFRRQIFVVIVVDLRHRRVDAGAQALDLDQGELAVRGRLAQPDAKMLLAGVDDAVR